jgi:hypothetical protein
MDAIFANIREKDGKSIAQGTPGEEGQVKRLSIDCKATVKIGDYARGGQTRGDYRAADHDTAIPGHPADRVELKG